MLKKMSAALLAVSMLAAPALATSSGKVAKAPATRIAQVNTDKTNKTNKTDKAEAPKAEAKMVSHHYKHHRHHVRRHTNKQIGALKAKSKVSYRHPTKSKVSYKHTSATTKRG